MNNILPTKMRYLIAIGVAAIASSARPIFAATPSNGSQGVASAQEGHGGRVRICTEADGSSTTEVLEYHVAKAFGTTLDLGPGPAAEDHINYVMDRLAKVDPLLAETWRKRALDFAEYAVSQPGTTLDQAKVNDKDFTNPIWYLIPDGCQELALVIQLKPGQQSGRFYGKKYLVDEEGRFTLPFTVKGSISSPLVVSDISPITQNLQSAGTQTLPELVK